MKSNSSIYPEKFFKSNKIIYIVDLSTVVESEILQEHEGEEPTVIKSYTYDYYELPISNRYNLSEYVDANYDILLNFAKVKQIERDRHSPTENEKLWDAVNYLISSDYAV